MPNYTLAKLAEEAKIEISKAILLLKETGLKISHPLSILPKKRVRKIRKILGISRDNGEIGISNLTEADEINEGEIAETNEQSTIEPKKRKIKIKRPYNQEKWQTIGPEEGVSYLNAKQIEEIHKILVEDFASSKDPIDPPGVRSHHLLESATFRPKTSIGNNDKYPTVSMAGAALLHALINNHPFHNGNKRTALVSLLVLLDKNGWVLTINQDLIYDFLLTVASHGLKNLKTGRIIIGADPETLFIARWLQKNMRRINRNVHPLQFRQLREILNAYGCHFESKASKGKMNIYCNGLKTQIHYDGEGREVEVETIKKVREDLHLDEEHGYDSDIFYNMRPRINDFINKYRKLLTKLAKV